MPVTAALTVPAVLIERAAAAPDRVWLEVWSPERGVSLRVTYAQMADSMVAAAYWLRQEMGVGDGGRVAMLAPNSVGYVAISLGAMAVGAASVNLNWRQPAETNERLIAQLRPALLVASSEHRAIAASVHRGAGVRVAHLEAVCAASPTALPFARLPRPVADSVVDAIRRLDARRVAAVFFTGGRSRSRRRRRALAAGPTATEATCSTTCTSHACASCSSTTSPGSRRAALLRAQSTKL